MKSPSIEPPHASPTHDFDGRLALLQRRLRRRGLDALLVTHPENRRYLGGFSAHDGSLSESSGLLFIPVLGAPVLMTDPRFEIQAHDEAKHCEIEIYRNGFWPFFENFLRHRSPKTLAVEDDAILLSTFRRFSSLASRMSISIHPLPSLVTDLRAVKTAAEIQLIHRSVLCNEKIFQEVYRELTPGMTEIDVAIRIDALARQHGAEGLSFPPIVASGPNAALPHAVPTQRRIDRSEPIIIDMGIVLNGYCSDMTRTVVLGPSPDFFLELHRLVRSAQKHAALALRPGIPCRSVDRAARQLISAAGHGPRFGHGLGHGVGLAVHEAPSLNRRNQVHLRPGMVVTIEPGIYIEGWGGIRLENMYALTPDGASNLNRDLTQLDL